MRPIGRIFSITLSGTIVPVRLFSIISTTLHESMRRYELLVCGEMGEGVTVGFGGRFGHNCGQSRNVINHRCRRNEIVRIRFLEIPSHLAVFRWRGPAVRDGRGGGIEIRCREQC
jgi:hypothetical protein